MKWSIVVALSLLIGCGESTEPETAQLSKGDVASINGKGDAADLDKMCEDLDREPGCDPCSIQGWYGDGQCDDFCPVRDTDCGIDQFGIDVTLAPGLSADLKVVYQATKDSFGCTDLTFDGLNPKRVPEQVERIFDGACASESDGSQQCLFEFNNDLDEGCLSVMRHIYLFPRNAAGTVDTFAALEFSLQEDLSPDDVEVVQCSEIMSGPGGTTPAMSCGIDLLHYSGSGTANIELLLNE